MNDTMGLDELRERYEHRPSVYYGPLIKSLEEKVKQLESEDKRLRDIGWGLIAAISRIDYLLGEPNEMEVSDYDLHYDEEVVIRRVKELCLRTPSPDDLRTVLLALEALTSGDRLPAGWSDALDRVRATLEGT